MPAAARATTRCSGPVYPRTRGRPYGSNRARHQGGPPEASEVAPRAPLPEHRLRPAASARNARARTGPDRPWQVEKASGRTGRQAPLPLSIGLASPPRPLDDFTPGAEARPGYWVFDRAFSASGASAPHPDRGTPPEPPSFIFVPRAAGKRCYRLQPWCYARGGQGDSAVYDAPHFPLSPLSSMGRGPG